MFVVVGHEREGRRARALGVGWGGGGQERERGRVYGESLWRSYARGV